MDSETAKKRIAQLSVELNDHNHRYYLLSDPSIDDFEFDQLLKDSHRQQIVADETCRRNCSKCLRYCQAQVSHAFS